MNEVLYKSMDVLGFRFTTLIKFLKMQTQKWRTLIHASTLECCLRAGRLKGASSIGENDTKERGFITRRVCPEMWEGRFFFRGALSYDFL